MSGWNVFRSGLTRALGYRWVLLILLAANLLSALCLVALPALSLVGPAHRTVIREAADGIDSWIVIEILLGEATSAVSGVSASSGEIQQGFLIGLVTAALLPLFSWIPAAFLTGGVLLTYAESPSSFRWRRYFWACWHWFGAFLLLGVLEGVFSLIVFGTAVTGGGIAISVLGRWSAWAIVPLLAALAVFWLAFFEIVRAVAIVHRTRNVFRALGPAVRVISRRFRPVVGLYGIALLFLLLIHAVFRTGLLPFVPLNWWLLVFIVHQGFILSRLLARVVRLAGGVSLVKESLIPMAQPGASRPPSGVVLDA